MRPARANDVALLVDLYDRAYGGGYSACFDKYGPIGPQDFWWVQAEKSVHLLEVNRCPTGLIILGTNGGRLLIEELLGAFPAAGHEPGSSHATEDVLLRRIYDFLLDQFYHERQDQMTLRASETNPLGLAFAQRFAFAFTNALVVGRVTVSPPPSIAPDGYVIRRATSGDEHELLRIGQECFPRSLPTPDVVTAIRHAQARVFVAERERYPVGLAVVDPKDEGVAQWSVGVREAHRRRGVGTALANAVLEFASAQKRVPLTTYWALDSAAVHFAHRQGCIPERTYLYFEKKL